ncbi:hypothetical protein CHLNCDRAFT_58364 [Chlorella variabilis]|uniref:Uncharacterized protein n=1 Tax=Chlorella variabilis TaxID=554065 RepID=E1ZJL6_CHLVA|nr:hypothetical protein CHLNCDRAFT_58364 [Chlorella variabilis]EFN53887.1 hypothetical protein CHLNCDRAFT_58364 [Chlorella variabilis]|eukprot:XP_005845989.1 hypothetical protein CHLNCDRAFT_58364 [Chlorella variabilis]
MAHLAGQPAAYGGLSGASRPAAAAAAACAGSSGWAPGAAPSLHPSQQPRPPPCRRFVSGSSERLEPAAVPAVAPTPSPAAAAPEPAAGPAAATAAGAAAAAPPGAHPDAFALVRDEIECVTERLRRDIFTEIPALERAAEYFFRAGAEGKRLRSTMLLLMASALAPAPAGLDHLTVDTSPPAEHPPTVRRRQQRIAEITELIHVASLLHDDVIDAAGTRRGKKSLNALFGNKVAILAGDFLLARASVSLAALRNPEAILLMSQSLEHLVAGEILQLTADVEEAASMDHYMRKTYCKTASLMANSCRAVAVLGGHGAGDCGAAAEYGRHVGLAFQLVDDVMDYTCSASEMGKPALNDLRSGLATAPVLYAAEERLELLPLIQRRFKEEGDVEAAQELVEGSSGLQRTRQLAAFHAEEAALAVQGMSPAASQHAAEHRQGLLQITQRVLNRKKAPNLYTEPIATAGSGCCGCCGCPSFAAALLDFKGCLSSCALCNIATGGTGATIPPRPAPRMLRYHREGFIMEGLPSVGDLLSRQPAACAAAAAAARAAAAAVTAGDDAARVFRGLLAVLLAALEAAAEAARAFASEKFHMPTGTRKTVTLLSLITSCQLAHPEVGKLIHCTRTSRRWRRCWLS